MLGDEMSDEESIKEQLQGKRKQLKDNISEVRKRITGNEELAEADMVERWQKRVKNFREDKGIIREKIDKYEPGRNVANIIGESEDKGENLKTRRKNRKARLKERMAVKNKTSKEPQKQKTDQKTDDTQRKEKTIQEKPKKTPEHREKSKDKKDDNPKQEEDEIEEKPKIII